MKSIKLDIESDEIHNLLGPQAEEETLFYSMGRAFGDIAGAEESRVPPAPASPSAFTYRPADSQFQKLASALDMQGLEIQMLFEAISESDNAMVLQNIKQSLILAKLTLDTSETMTARSMSTQRSNHDMKVEQYNKDIERIEEIKALRIKKITYRIETYKAKWRSLMYEARDELAKPKHQNSKTQNAVYVALVKALQKRDKSLVVESKSGYKFEMGRILSFGHKSINDIMQNAHVFLERFDEYLTKMRWASISIESLEHEFYQCDNVLHAFKLLYALLERNGIDSDSVTVDPRILEIELNTDDTVEIPEQVDRYLSFIQHRFFDQGRWMR